MRRMITAAVLACTCLMSVALAAPASAAAVRTSQNTLTTQAQVIAAPEVDGQSAGNGSCRLRTERNATRQVLVASQSNVLPPVQVARAAARRDQRHLGCRVLRRGGENSRGHGNDADPPTPLYGHVYIRYTSG